MVLTEKEYFKANRIDYDKLVRETEMEDFSFKVDESYLYGNGVLILGRCLSGMLKENEGHLVTESKNQVELIQVFPRNTVAIRKALYRGEKATLFAEIPDGQAKLFADCLEGKTLVKRSEVL